MLKNETHLLALHRVSEEIGVSSATVVRHPRDFFPTLLLGGKRWVMRESYKAWLARTRASTGVVNGQQEASR